MIGTYYNVENGMTSTLTLNNKGPQPIAVTPILYSPDGKRFIAAPVTVPGESSQNVELGILARFAGQGFQSGSFEFTYEGRMMEMGGGLRIVDEAKSLIFDEQMLEPGMKFSSPKLEAVYAIPFDSAEVRVIISNKTDKPVAVKGEAAFAGLNGHHPINGFLKPRETSVVALPAGLVKQARAGSVSLAHNGGAGALLAMIHVQEANKGYSASVNFTDPGQSKTSQYHGAGFRLGNINGDKLVPIIAVRNLGDVATTVTGRVPFTTENGTESKAGLRKTQLAAGEIKLIAVSGLPASNVAAAGLELEYEGAPGSVIADALSVSGSGNQVFTLPLKDPQGGMSSTGGYPWFITDTSSTVVFIKNTTAEPQQFHLDIVYPGGRWGSNLRTLAAGQTFKLDVREIRDTQVKSPDGTAIPLDASTGHVSWSLRGKRNKTLIGRAQTVDFAKGLASTYECQCACGSSYLQSELLPYSISGFPGDTQQFTAREQDVNCFGGPSAWYDVPTYLVFFSADNGNVATINSSGLGTAVGEGQTNIRASWETAGIFHMDASGECWNEPVTADCSSSCDVAEVTINGPINCMDGDTANLSVTVSPNEIVSSFEWSFTSPPGSGNDPQVSFGSPSSASTTASCKWFANPNSDCSANCISQYTIRATINFTTGRVETKETTLSVNGCWNPAGSVAPPLRTGGFEYGFDTSQNLWVVTGHTLMRVVQSPAINVSGASQFYGKVLAHENKHVDQWNTGMLSDLFTIPSLWAQLSPLTDATEAGLLAKIQSVAMAYDASNFSTYNSRLPAAEKEAYDLSDTIAPQYLYQNCGRYQ